MVAPLVEAVLLRLLRRRADEDAQPTPNRLVGARHEVGSIGYVGPETSVLLRRPGGDVAVLPAGRLVLPSLLARRPSTYEVVTHTPVDVWLRVGPFDTLDARTVHQVELRLTVAVSASSAGLRDLAAGAGVEDAGSREDAHGHAREERDPTVPDGLGAVLLDRLSREVTTRTTDAVHRRTLHELTDLSLGVLLDAALPGTFLGGLLDRSDLEVLDVDWPTEGSGWRPTLVPLPGGLADGSGPDPGAP